MAASDHVSKAQTGKYEFHRSDGWDTTVYGIYKGDSRVGRMEVEHSLDDDEDYGWQEERRPHRVAYMNVAQGHTVAGMTALGIAMNAAHGEGEKLTPDTSLSKHSSRLVRNMQGRGLVTQDRPNEMTNDMDFSASLPLPVDQRSGMRLNTTEVSAGRQTIRDMIKLGKRKK